MGILNEIIAKKRERLSYAKSKTPLSELKARIPDVKRPLDFKAAIRRTGERIRLIAEVKKASPSKGLIREDFAPAKIARIYREKADAISVLTEEDFFMGDLKYIWEVKAAADMPVLRKDFIFDEYQIYESRANGADAALLIAACLNGTQAEEYQALAMELGLSVLFEVHDMRELELALLINSDIIGINNRNLTTLKVDLNTTFEIKKEIPEGRVVVAESGIRTREDVLRLEGAGVDALLIGTAFMEAADIGRKMDELMGLSRTRN
ncbi:MAG: indole-3-glycerol phosphate synthase TrpC [Thermodesulfovibrionales bacterium]|nr:indole-3-glycerol phosphate synthase TrpC [Thermodesulfovibrionales bacterium]